MTTNEKRPSGLDQPLTVGNALKNDRLGRNGFARQAANALIQVTQEAGFAISVEGAWGSGKTSVLAMIEELLKSGEGSSPVIVRFNPWLVGDRDSLLRQFLISLIPRKGLTADISRASEIFSNNHGILCGFSMSLERLSQNCVAKSYSLTSSG